VQQRLLAYASDTHIFQAGLGPLGIGWANDYVQASSLDHAMWFHDSFRVDEWMLYVIDTPRASGSRAMGYGTMYRQDGVLVATVAQQGLIRILSEKREGKI
jgi:acyl-CoA thioesterase-2